MLVGFVYSIVSVVTYIIFWWDKRAATKNNWRFSENTLLLLSLLGGWPGALLARQQFRHKTQKQPFRTYLFLTVIINIALLIAFYDKFLQVLLFVAEMLG